LRVLNGMARRDTIRDGGPPDARRPFANETRYAADRCDRSGRHLPAVRVQPPRPDRAALPRMRLTLHLGRAARPGPAGAPLSVRASPQTQHLVILPDPERRPAAEALLADPDPSAAVAATKAAAVLVSDQRRIPFRPALWNRALGCHLEFSNGAPNIEGNCSGN